MIGFRQVFAAACWVTLLCGCRTVADYQAAELPAELRALAFDSPQQIDLSTLASHSISQNVIYFGDTLEVTMATGLEEREPQTWPIRVSEHGMARIPLVGEVAVGGLTLTEAEQRIRQMSIDREIYRQPHVSVLMKRRNTIDVRVVGAVETPGVYALPAAGSDLLAAVVAAGGLHEDAGTIIEIRHPNSRSFANTSAGPDGVALASFVESPETPPRIVRVDLRDIAAAHDPASQNAADLHLEDGSVVMVMNRENRSVSVIGLVRRPDNYDLPDDDALRLLDALALAGGPTVSVADKVRLIRHPSGHEDPISIAVSIREAKRRGKANLVLSPGDIVVVEETPTTVVVETIRSFIRFGFTSTVPGL